jgi:hypothetical protein
MFIPKFVLNSKNYTIVINLPKYISKRQLIKWL